MTKVFVYGTLVGEYDAEAAVLQGARKDETGAFPTIIPTPERPDSIVDGEVIKVDDENLDRLDRYEDEGYLYKRVEIDDGIQAYVGDTDKLACVNAWMPFDKEWLEKAFERAEVTTHAEVEADG